MKAVADEIIAVGIGNEKAIDEDQLKLLATRPDFVIKVNNFALLEAQLEKISSATCLAGTDQ